MANEQAKLSGSLALFKENDAARSASVEADQRRSVSYGEVDAARAAAVASQPVYVASTTEEAARARNEQVKAEAASAMRDENEAARLSSAAADERRQAKIVARDEQATCCVGRCAMRCAMRCTMRCIMRCRWCWTEI